MRWSHLLWVFLVFYKNVGGIKVGVGKSDITGPAAEIGMVRFRGLSVQCLYFMSGSACSGTRKPENPTRKSKTRPDPNPKIIDFLLPDTTRNPKNYPRVPDS